MKMPRTPPDWREILDALPIEKIRAIHAMSTKQELGGKYLHWDKLLYYPPPPGLTHAEWWCALKAHRQSLYKPVPLLDTKGAVFQMLTADPIPEYLHQIDLGAGGIIEMPDEITNPDSRDRYYISSLIEEAITSSQLEGASTTRQVAREMIRSGRPPVDRSERMIYNNFKTMKTIHDLKDHPLTAEMVFQIHQLITELTLDESSSAGRFRTAEEDVHVSDLYGTVFHKPPPAGQLPERLDRMCDFANGKTPGYFIHPVVRAIILHFWLAYDHPFVDGNGRTARALFYWSMLRQGYWLFEFVSISHILLKAPSQYGRSFLYTETDDNDLTYFIVYQLEVILRAIADLHAYIKQKARELKRVDAQLQGWAVLNHRQRALLAHALRHPGHRYTVQSHRISHNISYETSRSDLMTLCESGLLEKTKIGKTWHFTPVARLADQLSTLTDWS